MEELFLRFEEIPEPLALIAKKLESAENLTVSHHSPPTVLKAPDGSEVHTNGQLTVQDLSATRWIFISGGPEGEKGSLCMVSYTMDPKNLELLKKVLVAIADIPGLWIEMSESPWRIRGTDFYQHIQNENWNWGFDPKVPPDPPFEPSI